jgi:hypothetical protein
MTWLDDTVLELVVEAGADTIVTHNVRARVRRAQKAGDEELTVRDPAATRHAGP